MFAAGLKRLEDISAVFDIIYPVLEAFKLRQPSAPHALAAAAASESAAAAAAQQKERCQGL